MIKIFLVFEIWHISNVPGTRLNLYRYVRREKEILVTKMEFTESEAERLKNRSSFLEKQLDETRTCLEEERNKNHSSVQSLEQHQVSAKFLLSVLLLLTFLLNTIGRDINFVRPL